MENKTSSESVQSIIDYQICPVTRLPVLIPENWTNVPLTDDFISTFGLIGDSILFTAPAGIIDDTAMERFLVKRNEYLHDCGIYERDHVEIKDYRFLQGRTPKPARDRFVQFLLYEQNRGKLQGFFGFNAPFWMKNVFNLAITLFKPVIPVHLYGQYEHAVSRAVRQLAKDSTPSSQNDTPLTFDKNEIHAYLKNSNYDIADDLEKFFSHINTLNWLDAGLPDHETENYESHPLRSLYQAVNLLKTDFDEILVEKNEAEQQLKALNRDMEDVIAERTHALVEKSTILETSLNILSHDTKNLFFNISYLIDQELEGPRQTLFRDSYNELYESVMEATGYIKNKKRITSLIDVVLSLRVTKERIPFEHYSRIKLKYDGDPDNYYIETSTLFKNALLNLLENALKYTTEDSPIIVHIKREEDIIHIDVEDSGPGIPDSEKMRLLEKGYRRKIDNEKEGSGRGLWISANLVKKESGSLEILDNPSGGSIFRLILPAYRVMNRKKSLQELSGWFHIPLELIEERAENLETLLTLNNQLPQDPDTCIFLKILDQLRLENKEKTSKNIEYKLSCLKRKNPNGRKVLIVDDSLYVHYYLATYFTDLGYKIQGFEFNGQDGLDHYRKTKPDIVTMDNTMPVMSGIEAAKKIYREDSSARILFITALGDSSVISEEIHDGIPEKNFRILTKPFNKENLEEKLQSFQWD